jgi:multicomponent Na+:H+ antiporter subunit D
MSEFLGTVPPGLILILGALAIALSRGLPRTALIVLLPLCAITLIWGQPDGHLATFSFLDYELMPVRSDALSRLFATTFSIMLLAAGIFGLRQSAKAEMPATFVYGGGAVGAAMAGDLITLFVFIEVMAIASTIVIWSARTKAAGNAAQRYLIIHLLAGVVLMMGIVGEIAATGSIAFQAMMPDTLPRWLILIGFLINCGAPPFSAWVPDAYPEASWSGTVVLSGFTTKTAVCCLIRAFPGTEFLVPLGLFMVFYGIVWAILENDMRRILAYSLVNQVGFMVTCVGIGTPLALAGASAHAVAHIFYKGLLMMSAGAVLLQTGKRKCTDLGGLFQSMPITMVCGTIGALAISAFPLTSGYVAKSLMSQAAAEEHMYVTYILFLAAAAGVFLHAGIKYPWFVFFQKDSGLRPPDPPASLIVGMGVLTALCLLLGCFPGLFYAVLPYSPDYAPYTFTKVVQQLQVLAFSGLAFFLLLGALKRTLTITLDADWLYRVPGRAIGRGLLDAMTATAQAIGDFVRGVSAAFGAALFRHNGPQGFLARTRPTGSMVLWAVILLTFYLIVEYLGLFLE